MTKSLMLCAVVATVVSGCQFGGQSSEDGPEVDAQIEETVARCDPLDPEICVSLADDTPKGKIPRGGEQVVMILDVFTSHVGVEATVRELGMVLEDDLYVAGHDRDWSGTELRLYNEEYEPRVSPPRATIRDTGDVTESVRFRWDYLFTLEDHHRVVITMNTDRVESGAKFILWLRWMATSITVHNLWAITPELTIE